MLSSMLNWLAYWFPVVGLTLVFSGSLALCLGTSLLFLPTAVISGTGLLVSLILELVKRKKC